MHAKCCLSFFKCVGVHFNTFLVFLVDKLHGLTVGTCRIKPSMQQVSAISLYVHEPNGKRSIEPFVIASGCILREFELFLEQNELDSLAFLSVKP